MRRIQDQANEVDARFTALYGEDPETLESRKMLVLRALDTFGRKYGQDRSVIVSRAPGRINLLGNHIDHRGGYVNYVGISRDTVLVASANTDDTVRIVNANDRFHPSEFSITSLLPSEHRGDWHTYIENTGITPGNWENYIRAPILYLQDQYPDRAIKGMDIAVAGDVPIAAGLSSSSTLVVSTFNAATRFNDIEVPLKEQAEFCGAAEWYVGTRGGSGDHAAMLYAKRQALLHLRFFPLETEELPFPPGYRVVACNSCVEHAPPGIFNERIATYEIGLLMLKQAHPAIADRVEHLRDLNPNTTGRTVSEIYAMLRDLPIRASRSEIRAALPDHAERLDTLFSPHPEPPDGYRLRQVIMFGIGECARSNRGGELLRQDDLEGFGQLKRLSHDGDRQYVTGEDSTTPVDNPISDADLESLIASAPPLSDQSGGYDCSCEELDRLTDIANGVEGCVGAGLTGGGLGGCVLAIVQEDAVADLVKAVNDAFYTPRNLSDGTLVCSSAEGACII
jgi:N-acetylgalactosamine kinase